MAIYYNPVTRPDAAKTTIQVKGPVDPSSAFYTLGRKRASGSKEEALARGVTGPVFWIEDGVLMEGSSTGSFEYEPLTVEPSFVSGMNWNDAYFFTEESAKDWAAKCGCRHDPVRYIETCDVYKVHFHWIDNPRCMNATPKAEMPTIGSAKVGVIGHPDQTRDAFANTLKRMNLE